MDEEPSLCTRCKRDRGFYFKIPIGSTGRRFSSSDWDCLVHELAETTEKETEAGAVERSSHLCRRLNLVAVSGLSGYLYPAGLDEGIVRDGSFHSESIGFWVGRITFDDGRADVETVAGLCG